MNLIEIAERGLIPDSLVRHGIRGLLKPIPKQADTIDAQALNDLVKSFLHEIRQAPIAVATDAANTQHYEVPSEFFVKILGPRLKYSSCLWPEGGGGTLGEAEEAMLALYAERAQLVDGQAVLDMGCGWGSFSLWAAERFRNSQITGVSNSRTQREFILERAKERGLTNIEIITLDAREFALDRRFDRIISIEMFEHLRNTEAMLGRLKQVMNPGGKLFLHIFVHRSIPYIFPTDGPNDWMGREFFTGGMMPSFDLLLNMQGDFLLEDRWGVNGLHYAKTLKAWLDVLDAHRGEVLDIFRSHPRPGRPAEVEMQRWRMFLMACEELFAYRNGWEWFVGHYRFQVR
jgi:cyclopropane-fatty-acyl-phospholipid synthase